LVDMYACMYVCMCLCVYIWKGWAKIHGNLALQPKDQDEDQDLCFRFNNKLVCHTPDGSSGVSATGDLM
jgi:hypothetical protein